MKEKRVSWQIGLGTLAGSPGSVVRVRRVLQTSLFEPRRLVTTTINVVIGIRVTRAGKDACVGEFDPFTGKFNCSPWMEGDEIEVDIEIPSSGKVRAVIFGYSLPEWKPEGSVMTDEAREALSRAVGKPKITA